MKIMASGVITSWQIEGEKMEAMTDFLYLGSKITVDSDYSHKIKRHLLILRKAMINLVQFSSFQFSRSVVSDSLRPHESQHARPPCPSPTPGVHSNSRPLSRWCCQTSSSSVVPFCSCSQSLPASESFPISQLLAWGGEIFRTNFLLGCTGWNSLQSKGLLRIFSNTTVQKHQFFGTQLSL